MIYDSVAMYEDSWKREEEKLISLNWELIKTETRPDGNNVVYIRKALDNDKE